MILIYRDEATLKAVWDEFPFIGLCHLRGDFPRDEWGNPTEARLTDEPSVRPARSNDGRFAQSHPWGEEAMAEFEAYWTKLFYSGALSWHEALPADWLPEGWQPAVVEEVP